MLNLSTRMFKTRPMRTFLTVLGVGVGIGTVLFLVSLGYGLQNVILDRIATADTLLTLDVNAGPAAGLVLNEDSLNTIRNIPTVADISKLKNFTAQMTLGDITSNGQIVAVDHSFLHLRGVTTVAGSLYEEGDTYVGLISTAGVKLYNESPESIVGRTVKIILTIPISEESSLVENVPQEQPFTITGVFEDENASYLYMPLQSITGASIASYDALKVKVASSGVLEETRELIIAQGFVVSALSDVIEQAQKVFGVVQIVLSLFGLVALIVSAIGMFNTMTITLMERTNEIGIMRSIGITRTDIRKLFLVESMLMGFLGGIGGMIIGLGAGKIANFFINILATKFGGAALDLFFAPTWFLTFIMVFSTCIGVLTGIYPSMRASKLNPLDALRYK